MIQAEWTRGVRKDIQITVNGTAVSDEITALTYTDDINGDSGAVRIGSACAAAVEFTVAEPSVSYAGASLAISIAGVPLGVFTVTGARMQDGRLAVTAADAMAGGAMQDYFEPSAASGTALGVIREIAAGAGLQLADVSGISDVSVTGLSVGCTRREMLGRMAAVLGRNAHIDRYGKLCLRWYENSGGAVGPGDIYAGGIEKAEADYEIEKIECSVTTVTETTEDDTTTEQTQTVVLEAGTGTMGISLDCPYMTQAILDGIYRRIGGFSFRPMNLTIYGDCRIETGDILTVTDPDNVVYTVPVMAVTHTWDGGVKTVIKAAGEIAAEGNGQLRGTLGQAVARLEAELARFRNLEAENITVLRGRISQLFADWAHIGEAIIDTLEAEGINADWINTGSFVVKDANDNVIFEASIGTGTRPATVRMAGFTAQNNYLAGDSGTAMGVRDGSVMSRNTSTSNLVAFMRDVLSFQYFNGSTSRDYGGMQINDDGESKYTVNSSGTISETVIWNCLQLIANQLLDVTGPVTFEETPAFEKNVLVLGNLYVRGGGSGTSSTNILTTLNNKAPTNHASTEQTYGITSASNYGHAKLVSGLLDLATQPTTAGCVTSAVQGWTLAQRTKMKTKTVSGSTNANGNLSLGLSSSSASVLGTSSTSTGTYLCVPFLNSGGDWVVRVLDANGSSVKSTNIGSITVYYLATA